MTPYSDKKKAAPLTLDILTKLTTPLPLRRESTDDLNRTVITKVAFAGFLRSEEFTYDDRMDKRTLVNTRLTRSGVTFDDVDDHHRRPELFCTSTQTPTGHRPSTA